MAIRVLVVGLFSLWLVGSFGCGEQACKVETCVDVVSFQAMAREAQDCAQNRNRLFLIDRTLVFWDMDGDCPETYYTQALFACTVDDVLCWEFGTLSGPRRVYADSSYREMFETILSNLDRGDLGLCPSHEVRRIEF
jgi:hypothetical protein